MYSKNTRKYNFLEADIVLGTFDVRSTLTTDAQYHIFHDHNRELKIIVPINMQITDHHHI